MKVGVIGGGISGVSLALKLGLLKIGRASCRERV